MIRAGAAFSLCLLGCCTGANHAARPASQQLVEALDPKPCVVKDGVLEHASFYRSYADDPVTCWRLSVDGVTVRTSYRDGPNGAYRVVVISDDGVPHRATILYVAGGPRLTTISYDLAKFRTSPLFGFARQGVAVVTIDHLGTISRSLYPRSDIDPAAIEVDEVAETLRAADVKFEAIVAASAGALVGASLLARKPWKMVLLSPPFASLKELVLAYGSGGPSRNARHHVRSFSAIAGPDTPPRAVRASDEQQVSAYAGRRYDSSLPDLIHEIPLHRHRCLSVVYGDADPLIRIERARLVSMQLKDVRLRRIAGYGHQSASVAQGGAVASIVTQEFGRLSCGGQPASRN